MGGAPGGYGGYGAGGGGASDMTCIIEPAPGRPGLYLGGYTAASDYGLLRAYNIRAVLTCAAEAYLQYPYDLVPLHKQILVDDHELYWIKSELSQCTEFINKARASGYNILVHCMAGVSRSATVVIGYLMAMYGYSFDQAYREVQMKRPIINPNSGFVGQLQSWEYDLRKRPYEPDALCG
jgi:dual specificity phosphatase 12